MGSDGIQDGLPGQARADARPLRLGVHGALGQASGEHEQGTLEIVHGSVAGALDGDRDAVRGGELERPGDVRCVGGLDHGEGPAGYRHVPGCRELCVPRVVRKGDGRDQGRQAAQIRAGCGRGNVVRHWGTPPAFAATGKAPLLRAKRGPVSPA